MKTLQQHMYTCVIYAFDTIWLLYNTKFVVRRYSGKYLWWLLRGFAAAFVELMALFIHNEI